MNKITAQLKNQNKETPPNPTPHLMTPRSAFKYQLFYHSSLLLWQTFLPETDLWTKKSPQTFFHSAKHMDPFRPAIVKHFLRSQNNFCFNTMFCYLRLAFNDAAYKSKITSFPVTQYSLAYIFTDHINPFRQVITVGSMCRGLLEPYSLRSMSTTCTPACRAATNTSFDGFLVLFTGRFSFPSISLLSSPLHTTLLVFVLCKNFPPCVLQQWRALGLTLNCNWLRNHRSVQPWLSIDSYLLSSVRRFVIHLTCILMLLNRANASSARYSAPSQTPYKSLNALNIYSHFCHPDT